MRVHHPPKSSKNRIQSNTKIFLRGKNNMRKRGNILKWIGTSVLILGTGINSLGIYPLGPILLGLGGLIWMTVGILWKENSLIVTNLVLSLVTLIGITITLL